MRKLLNALLYLPQAGLEKASDHFARKAQEMEFIEGIFSTDPKSPHINLCSCAPIYSPTKQGLYELADITLSFLAHPRSGERKTKCNMPDLSWDR